MSEPRSTSRRSSGRSSVWCWLAGVFLAALGARLWLIHRFGTALPFWDQWEQARVVYLPYFDGTFSLADLFSAHNEHRIVFTRLYELALFLLNGQWDGQLQMVINGGFHCATLVGLGWLMARWIEKEYWTLLWLPLLLVLALPFGWENSLAGFQSQFYFLVLFSLLTIWLLGLHPAMSAPWWCGVVAAVVSLFTLASGFLAGAAVFGLGVFRVWRRPTTWKSQVPTLCVCGALVVAGLLLKGEVKFHHALQAHSAGEFLTALGDNLAWPWIVVPPFAVLNLLPLGILAWCYFRSAGDRPAEEMTLTIGLWTILQGAAAAYARGAEGRPPGWRYMDSSSFILVANCFSIAIILSRYRSSFSAFRRNSSASSAFSWLARRAVPILYAAFALWGVTCLAGLVLLTSRAWSVDIPERELYYRSQLQLTRAFMATDDIHVFDGKPKSELPYYQGNPLAPQPSYEAELIVQYLRNPLIRSMLPASARLPLAVRPDPAMTHGFETNGFRLARREPSTELSWGSCSAQGSSATGSFESLPVPKSRFPYLEISVAGDLGEQGLSLDLVELPTGRRIPVAPSRVAGGKWVDCYVRAPAGEFKIVARDVSQAGWFAFKPPREVGRLSFWAVEVLRAWKYLLFAGLGILLLNPAVQWIRRRSKHP